MKCKKETKRAEKRRYRNKQKGIKSSYQFKSQTQSIKVCIRCNKSRSLSSFLDLERNPFFTKKYLSVCITCRKKGGENYSSADARVEPTISKDLESNKLANSKLNMAVKLGEKKIEIKYQDKRGNITTRKVDIFECTHQHLIGYCFKVNERRTFLRSGILELKRLEFEKD